TPVNDAPVVNADTASTAEDTPVAIDVLANDVDVDGNLDRTSVTITAPPAHGTTSVNATTGVVTYAPAQDFNGADTFTYRVCDSAGPSGPARLSSTLTPVNDAPVVNADTATTPEDTPVAIDVLANDVDVDGNLDRTSVTITAAPAHGTVAVNHTTGVVT